VPETSDGAQGALTRLRGQGLQQTSARRRAISATARGEYVARLMRCSEAARLKWTVWDQTSVWEIAALSVTEKGGVRGSSLVTLTLQNAERRQVRVYSKALVEENGRPSRRQDRVPRR